MTATAIDFTLSSLGLVARPQATTHPPTRGAPSRPEREFEGVYWWLVGLATRVVARLHLGPASAGSVATTTRNVSPNASVRAVFGDPMVGGEGRGSCGLSDLPCQTADCRRGAYIRIVRRTKNPYRTTEEPRAVPISGRD
jgi:hypothetical protein